MGSYQRIRRIIARSVCALALYFLTLAVTGVLFLGFFPWAYKQFDHEPWRVRYSPDRRFSVEYYTIPFLPFRPPYFCIMEIEPPYSCPCFLDKYGDDPGYIRLVDNTNGDTLQERYFLDPDDVVGHGAVDWKEDEVSIKQFARWPLPRRRIRGSL